MTTAATGEAADTAADVDGAIAQSRPRRPVSPSAVTAATLLSPGQRVLAILVSVAIGGGLVLDTNATATVIFAGWMLLRRN